MIPTYSKHLLGYGRAISEVVDWESKVESRGVYGKSRLRYSPVRLAQEFGAEVSRSSKCWIITP